MLKNISQFFPKKSHQQIKNLEMQRSDRMTHFWFYFTKNSQPISLTTIELKLTAPFWLTTKKKFILKDKLLTPLQLLVLSQSEFDFGIRSGLRPS